MEMKIYRAGSVRDAAGRPVVYESTLSRKCLPVALALSSIDRPTFHALYFSLRFPKPPSAVSPQFQWNSNSNARRETALPRDVSLLNDGNQTISTLTWEYFDCGYNLDKSAHFLL